jgi:phosphomannomutase
LPAQAADRRPTVLLGGDDRPWTAACFAAASEGLRWSGCHVVDIGPASAPCLADTLQRLRAAGGLLIHNPSEREHLVGLKFWGPGAQPLARHDLARVEQLFHVPPDRPTRVYGSLDRLPAESGYLAHIAPCYHAMRPLQWVLHSACTPLVGYIRQLSARVACRVTVVAAAGERLGAQVLVHGSHFGLHVDGQGESCQWFDEAGRAVAAERMFLLMSGDWSIFRPNGVALANQSLAENMDLSPLRPENRNVILEEDSSPELQRELQARGFTVVRSGAARAEMAAAMHTHEAVLGGGPSGRFWHPKGTVALPDALMTLTLLLLLLSRNDRPLSTVLDAEASLR